MKVFSKVIKYVLAFVCSAGAFVGATYLYETREYFYAEHLEKLSYAVWAVALMVVFSIVSKKIKAVWGKLTLGAGFSLIFTAAVFLSNNFWKFRWLNLEFYLIHPITYLDVLKSDLSYRGGYGIFRYVFVFILVTLLFALEVVLSSQKVKNFFKGIGNKIEDYFRLKDLSRLSLEELYLDSKEVNDYDDFTFFIGKMKLNEELKEQVAALTQKYSDDKELPLIMIWRFEDILSREEYLEYKNQYLARVQREIERKREFYNNFKVELPSAFRELDEKFGVEE